MPNYIDWCDILKQACQEKDIPKILSLFSEDVIYFEDPTSDVLSFSDIAKIWEDINDQQVIDLTYKILCQENDKCIVNFILTSNPSYDMIYEIILDDHNKCHYFKQWYMEV